MNNKITFIIAAFGLTLIALAHPPMTRVFNTKYEIRPSSKLAEAKCGVCHIRPRGGELNPYGRDIKVKMAGERKLTPRHLAMVENLDSDRDGKSNITEIRADSLPGKR